MDQENRIWMKHCSWMRGQVAVEIVVSNLRRGRSSAGASSGGVCRSFHGEFRLKDQKQPFGTYSFFENRTPNFFRSLCFGTFWCPSILIHIFSNVNHVWPYLCAPFPSPRRRQSLFDSRAIRGMQQGTYALRGRVHILFLSIKDPLYIYTSRNSTPDIRIYTVYQLSVYHTYRTIYV